MCVVAVDNLRSQPNAVQQEQIATLIWTLQTTGGASETALVEYTLQPGSSVVFTENGQKRITANHLVNATPTVTRRPYSLTGNSGIVVTIMSHVVQGPPCDPNQLSVVAVTILA